MAKFAKCLATCGVLTLAACGGHGTAPVAPFPSPAASAASAPGGGPAAAVALKVCTGGVAAASDGLVDDFEDGNGQGAPQAGRGGYWYTAADPKGSAISPSGEFTPGEGGAAGSKKSAHVSGKTAAGDGAWGAGFGLSLLPDNQIYDASKYAGVSFWAKAGDKSTTSVRFKVADVNTRPEGKVCKEPGGCWNHFGTDLTLSKEWKEHSIKFTDLKQQEGWGDPRPPALTANQAMSLDWSVSGGQEFDVWVDEVKFIDCK